jgi:hypothetical protein
MAMPTERLAAAVDQVLADSMAERAQVVLTAVARVVAMEAEVRRVEPAAVHRAPVLRNGAANRAWVAVAYTPDSARQVVAQRLP